ncbi:sigma-54-dependent Fis family transcriptional regulator [bacterium]|nr:sigma-54-dependent Fis family transcriptional regulator [bacterium]
MQNITELLDDLNKKLDEGFKDLSARFADLNNSLARKDYSRAETILSALFKTYMESHRLTNSHVVQLGSDIKKFENQVETIAAEKEQFKALYNSGMSISNKNELQGLITFAMDQITYHLRAERGFLILVDETGQKEYFVSKNFDGQNINDPANEVCTSVIKKTLDVLQPVKIDDDSMTDSFTKQGSFVRLGLRSVLCVPIIYRKTLLGVVYLDRRDDVKSFSDNDLSFLMAFAKQTAFRVNELKEMKNVQHEYERRDRSRLQELREKYNFKEIVGTSEKLVQILELSAKVAPTDVPILILGESGTGKELIARAIHFNSDRFDRKFIAINCAAIPSDLLESELFGFDPGAFTGAVKSKLGKFELAHQGTLFLDEIAELSVNLQAKILRVVQTKELERLGSTETRRIDIRIISATNKKLDALIKEGKFREDLYYRLKVVEIVVPPLRDRKEDIQLLINYFIQKYSQNKITSISDEAVDILEHYQWDGNIRELENVIQRAAILSSTSTIQSNDLPLEIIAKVDSGYKIKNKISLEEAEKDFRKWFIVRTLRKVNNNKTKAAELLGINRTHFFRMLNQLGISE